MEENPDGENYPAISKAIKETYRILKPGGVLTITTITPEQFDAHWCNNLIPQNKERWHRKLPSLDQMKDMLSGAGFALKSAHSTLAASYHPDHDYLEGPMHESWRSNISFWNSCTKSEIEEMVRNVGKMKQDGTLQEYFKAHEKIETFGALLILAVQK